MRFGVITIAADESFSAKSGSVFQHHVVLDTSEILDRAVVSSLDLVCFVVKTQKTVVFEVDLPAPLSGVQLDHAIQFEVENYVPFPLESIYWGYRRNPENNRNYRVFAVLRTEVDALYQKISDFGFKFDYFIPQQLLADLNKPVVEHSDHVGGNFNKAENVQTDIQTPLQLFLDMLTEDPACNRLYLDACAVPKIMQPIRHRMMKFVNGILLAAAVILCLFVLWSQFSSYRQKMETLKLQNNELQEQADLLEKDFVKLQQQKSMQDKISELQLFGTYVLPVISDLNMRLPDHMYVTSYIQNAESVEVTVLSTRDDGNLPRILMESELYQADLRKTVQPDTKQTTYIVTLRGVKTW